MGSPTLHIFPCFELVLSHYASVYVASAEHIFGMVD